MTLRVQAQESNKDCPRCGPKTGKYPWRCGYCATEWKWSPLTGFYKRGLA
jgi:hypothetical protein